MAAIRTARSDVDPGQANRGRSPRIACPWAHIGPRGEVASHCTDPEVRDGPSERGVGCGATKRLVEWVGFRRVIYVSRGCFEVGFVL